MSLRQTRAGAYDLLALHRHDPARYPFLLESVAGHPQSGRYDLLMAFPEAALVQDADGLSGPHAEAADFFAALDAWAAADAMPPDADEVLPFVGGWFLYLAYEAGARIEPSVQMPAADKQLPEALAVRCPAALVYDRQQRCLHLIAEQDPQQLQSMLADLDAASADAGRPLPACTVSEEPAAKFTDGVRRIIEYLRAGDVFQVNLSRLWRAEFAVAVNPADLYAALRKHNPAPFAGLMRWGDAAVLSSSPERLAQISGRELQTRPIAGTRPRAAEQDTDLRRRTRLIENLKERAEHVMLLDLERNDLGRVCEPGSIEVSELMTVESYAHVHHIVSNVRGRLRPGVGPGAVLKAVFPGGTITGCPKVRAMQIIAELEQQGRGPYTGSMGYLNRDGRMDSNILIRSIALQGSTALLRAGAGIVADSVPEFELQEARDKAKGLLMALGQGA